MTDEERKNLCAKVRAALPGKPDGYRPEVYVFCPEDLDFLKCPDVDGYVLRVGTPNGLLFVTTGATPTECEGRMLAALEWKP